eukprot:6312652-Alexandrium_andersonii.AAC.1
MRSHATLAARARGRRGACCRRSGHPAEVQALCRAAPPCPRHAAVVGQADAGSQALCRLAPGALSGSPTSG